MRRGQVFLSLTLAFFLVLILQGQSILNFNRLEEWFNKLFIALRRAESKTEVAILFQELSQIYQLQCQDTLNVYIDSLAVMETNTDSLRLLIISDSILIEQKSDSIRLLREDVNILEDSLSECLSENIKLIDQLESKTICCDTALIAIGTLRKAITEKNDKIRKRDSIIVSRNGTIDSLNLEIEVQAKAQDSLCQLINNEGFEVYLECKRDPSKWIRVQEGLLSKIKLRKYSSLIIRKNICIVDKVPQLVVTLGEYGKTTERVEDDYRIEKGGRTLNPEFLFEDNTYGRYDIVIKTDDIKDTIKELKANEVIDKLQLVIKIMYESEELNRAKLRNIELCK